MGSDIQEGVEGLLAFSRIDLVKLCLHRKSWLTLLERARLLKTLGLPQSRLFAELFDVAFVENGDLGGWAGLDVGAAGVGLEHCQTLLDRHRLELHDRALPHFLLLDELLDFDLLETDLSELIELLLVLLRDALQILLGDLAVRELLVDVILLLDKCVLTLKVSDLFFLFFDLLGEQLVGGLQLGGSGVDRVAVVKLFDQGLVFVLVLARLLDLCLQVVDHLGLHLVGHLQELGRMQRWLVGEHAVNE